MATAKIYDLTGQSVGEQDLADNVFGMPINEAVLHQVVTSQMVNRRQGNASTKTRAQVSGGNSKPYRQKGTGRARQGSTRAPQFRGGGNVFGPHPHEYHHKINRKMKRIAIRSALSDKALNERVLMVQETTMDMPKTKTMITFFESLALTDDYHKVPSVLVLLGERDENFIASIGNIHHVKYTHVSAINVVELMKHDYLMLSPDALAFIEATFDDGAPRTTDAAEGEE
ncbi:MAG: 50S ribosomal protein L4 [Ktedonobacterales bacterium]|nr:50S ribosomal protein L4 [Ktedonobacterales bacterium]